jgi:formylglycine-generating enzyme
MDKPEMIAVEGGTFKMGSTMATDEKPHDVTLSSFAIAKNLVTVAEYKAFCEATKRKMPFPPAWGWNDNHPMVIVTSIDAEDYCKWLSATYGSAYRLPTEAEWEYAAKGGNKSQGYTFSGGNDMKEVGWFGENSGGKTNPVGTKNPNELGIYDMSGNVYEWCQDWYGDSYYGTEPSLNNPQGPPPAIFRVVRGGSWQNGVDFCNTHLRQKYNPKSNLHNRGFRVACN